MNRQDFAKRYAKEYNIKQDMAKEVCDSVFELLNKVLIQGEDVTILGLGVFKQKTVKGHNVRHPVTGLIVKIPTKKVVVFKKEIEDIDVTE